MVGTTALIIAAATAVSSMIARGLAARSERLASETQAEAATDALTMQNEQFQGIQESFNPYVEAGNNAVRQQEALTGALGPEAQQEAIQGIKDSPQFQSMLEQGETSILQNASATGGLRGGNTQGALAQFSPQLLSGLLDQRFNQLGGLTQTGLGAAGAAANAGMTGAGMMGDTMLQRGAYEAGGDLARGRFWAGVPGDISQGIGLYQGLSGGKI